MIKKKKILHVSSQTGNTKRKRLCYKEIKKKQIIFLDDH